MKRILKILFLKCYMGMNDYQFPHSGNPHSEEIIDILEFFK